MTQSGSPPPEPTNGEIKTLLVEHMRASNEHRDRQAKDYARLDQKLQTVVDEQVRVRSEMDRLKSDLAAAERIARNAESTAVDLRGAVMREVGKISTEQARRDEAAAATQKTRDDEVKSRLTSQDAVLTKQNHELAHQTKTLGTLLAQIGTVLGIVKATPAVVAILAALLGGVIWLSQHAR